MSVWQRVFHVQFLHVSVFSDSPNVQKSVTQIIYLTQCEEWWYNKEGHGWGWQHHWWWICPTVENRKIERDLATECSTGNYKVGSGRKDLRPHTKGLVCCRSYAKHYTSGNQGCQGFYRSWWVGATISLHWGQLLQQMIHLHNTGVSSQLATGYQQLASRVSVGYHDAWDCLTSWLLEEWHWRATRGQEWQTY